MKTEAKLGYATTPKDITALAASVMGHKDGETTGRATYLRSLVAGAQIELLGKPVLRALRANHKPPTQERVLETLEKVNQIYYEAVLAAVPETATPEERNSKTNFARSAMSTVRRALKYDWPVLTPLGEVSKTALTDWSVAHAPARVWTLEKAQHRVESYLERITEMLESLQPTEAEAIARAAVAELSGIGGAAPQKLRAVTLQKHVAAIGTH